MTLALATGAVAFVVVAVMVVAILPQQTADPLVSATTAPVAAVRVARSDATADSARARLVSVTRIPNQVSSAGLPAPDDLPIADAVPEGDQPVIVLTDDFTYWVEWSALPRLDLPEESIIVDAGGALVGHVSDGDLVLAIDD